MLALLVNLLIICLILGVMWVILTMKIPIPCR